LTDVPWVRTLGRLDSVVTTEGWRFPVPLADPAPIPAAVPRSPAKSAESRKPRVKPRPSADTLLVKDRLLYLLQPPLENLFGGRQLPVPFQPFKYQLEG